MVYVLCAVLALTVLLLAWKILLLRRSAPHQDPAVFDVLLCRDHGGLRQAGVEVDPQKQEKIGQKPPACRWVRLWAPPGARPWRLPAVSLGTIAASTGIGLALFRRKDLK
mgnify:CR=1 FL=1